MTDVLSAVGEEITWLGRPVRRLLFDMDGTLAHTREAHGDVWVEWSRVQGFEISRDDYMAHLYGRSNRDVLTELRPELATQPEELAAMTHEKEGVFRRMVADGRVPGVRGAAEFIRRTHERGMPMAVASAAPRDNVDIVLEMLGVGDCIEVRVGEHEVERTKPEPDAYLQAAGRLGLDARDCVVFEDSRFGLLAGRAAGSRTVAILSQHTAEELAELADLAVLDFEVLMGRKPWCRMV